MWDYLPYRSGPTVSFQEATMYLSDLDDTSDIAENRGNEYFEPYREDLSRRQYHMRQAWRIDRQGNWPDALRPPPS
jgi:hypothetical protein